jgi:chemotaxis signal transduction protein
MHLLIVEFGGVHAALPLGSIAAVQQCEVVCALGVPALGAAAVQFNTRLLPCVDLAGVLLAAPVAPEPSSQAVVVVLDSGTRLLGLFVDGVQDVIEVAPRALAWLPPLLLQSSHPALHAIARLESGELLPVVAPEFLLSCAELAALDRALGQLAAP